MFGVYVGSSSVSSLSLTDSHDRPNEMRMAFSGSGAARRLLAASTSAALQWCLATRGDASTSNLRFLRCFQFVLCGRTIPNFSMTNT